MHNTLPAAPKDEKFEALKLGLNSFNAGFVNEILHEKVASFVKDESDKVMGGILGDIKWGWLYVEGLWVDESLCGQDWGTTLLKSLEDYALANGITRYRLETTSFQALGFYRKMGYDIFAELPDFPPGLTSYFLKKLVK
jgi:GNAT superfamily N-acetyltransferase